MGQIFARCTRNGQTAYSSHNGMDQATVTGLLTDLGATNIQYIDETAYQTAISALQVK